MNELPEGDQRFAETMFVVEADSFARHMLWREYSSEAGTIPGATSGRGRFSWNQHNQGWAIQVGEFGGLPVVVNCSWAEIAGKLVLFYHPCSMVTHSGMVDEWLKGRCSPTWDGGRRRAHCDAMNFHHCLDAIAEAEGGRGGGEMSAGDEWYEVRFATTPDRHGPREITWCRRDTEGEARAEMSKFSKEHRRRAHVVRCTVVYEAGD